MRPLLLLLWPLPSEALFGGVNDVMVSAAGNLLGQLQRPSRSAKPRSKETLGSLLDIDLAAGRGHTGESNAALMRSHPPAFTVDPRLLDPNWISSHKKIERDYSCEWKPGAGTGGNMPIMAAGFVQNYEQCKELVQAHLPYCNGCTIQKGGFGRCWGVMDGTGVDTAPVAGMETETCYFKYWRHPDGPWGLATTPISNWEPEAGTITEIKWPSNFCLDMAFRIPMIETPFAYRTIALVGGEQNSSCGDFYIFLNDANEIGMGVECDGGNSSPPLMHPDIMVTFQRHNFRFCYDTEHWHARIWEDDSLKIEAPKIWNFPRHGYVSVFAGVHNEIDWNNSLIKHDGAELYSMEMWENTTTTTTTTTITTTITTATIPTTTTYPPIVIITLATSTSTSSTTTTITTTTWASSTSTTTSATRPWIEYHHNDTNMSNVTVNVTKIIRTVVRTITDTIINTSNETKEVGKQNGTWYLTQRACWAYPCGDGYVALGEPHHCWNWTCTRNKYDFDECCRLRDSCQNFDCGYGAEWRMHPENILCESYKCNVMRDRETCCHIYASCKLKFICPEGYRLKEWDRWPAPTCGATHCDAERDMDRCCEEVPTTTTTEPEEEELPSVEEMAEELGLDMSKMPSIVRNDTGKCEHGFKTGGYCICGNMPSAAHCWNTAQLNMSSCVAVSYDVTTKECYPFQFKNAPPDDCPSNCTASEGTGGVAKYEGDGTPGYVCMTKDIAGPVARRIEREFKQRQWHVPGSGEEPETKSKAFWQTTQIWLPLTMLMCVIALR